MFKPWLLLPSSLGHKLSPYFFRIYGKIRPYKTYTWKPFAWRGMEFTNPLGVAGGFDKNATMVQDLWSWGTGFVEVGTVTCQAQKVNPGKTLDRDNSRRALWNQLGFPSEGARKVKKRLKDLRQPHFTPVFVNIGKNRNTPMDQAYTDYVKLVRTFADVADAFVINISSPNTPHLRTLLSPEKLPDFLSEIMEESAQASPGRPVPVLLKLSPDMTTAELKKIIDVSLQCEVDGFVLTNTTLEREPGMTFPNTGGVSGKPLQKKSREMLQEVVQYLGKNKKDKLIVSVGGVMDSQDVFERLNMGADLVQIYSSLIFEGPFFFKDVFEASMKHFS